MRVSIHYQLSSRTKMLSIYYKYLPTSSPFKSEILLTYSLHENTRLLEQLRQKLFCLWGPLEEGTTSNVLSSSPPKPIRKKQRSSKKEPLQVRFSDDIYYDDDSSSSLDARYPAWDEDDGEHRGGKIVKARGMIGGLSSGELKKGIWFETCLKEFWVRESEAVFGVRRWRLFGTRVQ